MLSKHFVLSLTCAAVLAGCASTTPLAPPPPAPTMAALLETADLAHRAGNSEGAIATLKTAARFYPADKAAWLRIAQVSFDSHAYGEAITYAKKVLERDPDDMVAHSIAAVSGLRVSSQALADLTLKSKVTGDVRDAAQDLAKILRTSIGGDILPPATVKRDRAPPGAKLQATVKSSGDSLLDVLNRPNDPVRK
jgi:tetratricopeptide (TPR) repeat protein